VSTRLQGRSVMAAVGADDAAPIGRSVGRTPDRWPTGPHLRAGHCGRSAPAAHMPVSRLQRPAPGSGNAGAARMPAPAQREHRATAQR